MTSTFKWLWLSIGVLAVGGFLFALSVYHGLQRKQVVYETCAPAWIGKPLGATPYARHPERVDVRKPDAASMDLGWTLRWDTFWVCRIDLDDGGIITGVRRIDGD